MVPDWNYTPSYMRPQLFSGAHKARAISRVPESLSDASAGPARAAHPVQPGPGLMSQAAALRDTAGHAQALHLGGL